MSFFLLIERQKTREHDQLELLLILLRIATVKCAKMLVVGTVTLLHRLIIMRATRCLAYGTGIARNTLTTARTNIMGHAFFIIVLKRLFEVYIRTFFSIANGFYLSTDLRSGRNIYIWAQKYRSAVISGKQHPLAFKTH